MSEVDLVGHGEKASEPKSEHTIISAAERILHLERENHELTVLNFRLIAILGMIRTLADFDGSHP